MTRPKFSAGYAGRENVFRGHAQRDLIGADTWNLVSLSVAGPELSPAQVEVLDRIALAVTVPDPRIWPLTLSRLLANSGNPGTAIGNTLLAMDDSPIGPKGFQFAAEFLQSADLDALPDEMPGFVVMSRAADERLDILGELLDGEGRAISLWRAIVAKSGKSAHVSSAAAALLLDLGFTPVQIFFLMIHAHLVSFYATVYDGVTYGYHPTLDELAKPSE